MNLSSVVYDEGDKFNVFGFANWAICFDLFYLGFNGSLVNVLEGGLVEGEILAASGGQLVRGATNEGTHNSQVNGVIFDHCRVDGSELDMHVRSDLGISIRDVKQLHRFLDASSIGMFGSSVQYVAKLVVNRVDLGSLSKSVTGTDVSLASRDVVMAEEVQLGSFAAAGTGLQLWVKVRDLHLVTEA